MNCFGQLKKRANNPRYFIRAGGTWVFLAMITDVDGNAVQPSDILSITRSIHTSDTPGNKALKSIYVPNSVFTPPINNPEVWTHPYNFRDVVEAIATPDINVTYVVEYEFRMADTTILKTSSIDVGQFSPYGI